LAKSVVIVGGGVMGSAAAYFLSLRGCRDVTVIERDPSYARASSALSASSIRQQFSTPLCVRMSQFGMQFLRDAGDRLATPDAPAEVGLVERGYLCLAEPGAEDELVKSHRMQVNEGADIELLDRAALGARYPWMNAGDLALAAYGRSGEGWFDGYSLLQAFRRAAQGLGARYVRDTASGLLVEDRRVRGLRLASGATLPADEVVNAAGPHAAEVAAWAGLDLPVRPERRTVFVFDCRDPPPLCPLVVDVNGLYFRPEGPRFIAGGPASGTAPSDPFDLEPDHAQFEDFIWPALAARVPAFESIKLAGAWAGHYEMNLFDHNAVIGRPPGVDGLVLMNGFSGHGMQHAPAAGRGVAELILDGGFRTLDLGALAPDRLGGSRGLVEARVI
jgi:FAD-dependent oxidoreductase domain-containing protein 1